MNVVANPLLAATTTAVTSNSSTSTNATATTATNTSATSSLSDLHESFSPPLHLQEKTKSRRRRHSSPEALQQLQQQYYYLNNTVLLPPQDQILGKQFDCSYQQQQELAMKAMLNANFSVGQSQNPHHHRDHGTNRKHYSSSGERNSNRRRESHNGSHNDGTYDPKAVRQSFFAAVSQRLQQEEEEQGTAKEQEQQQMEDSASIVTPTVTRPTARRIKTPSAGSDNTSRIKEKRKKSNAENVKSNSHVPSPVAPNLQPVPSNMQPLLFNMIPVPTNFVPFPISGQPNQQQQTCHMQPVLESAMPSTPGGINNNWNNVPRRRKKKRSPEQKYKMIKASWYHSIASKNRLGAIGEDPVVFSDSDREQERKRGMFGMYHFLSEQQLHAKRALLKELNQSKGEMHTPEFQAALQQLLSTYDPSHFNPRVLRTAYVGNCLEGIGISAGKPTFPGCIGYNAQGDPMYKLGRMSFGKI